MTKNSGRSSKQPQPKTDAELISDFAHGIEERNYTTVAMQSPNFVIFHVKGHGSWAGVGMGQAYVRAQYILIRKGTWWMAHGIKHGVDIREWEGRLSKKTMKEALRRSEMLKTPYMGDFTAPMCEECNVEMNYGEGQEGNKIVAYYHCEECGWSIDA